MVWKRHKKFIIPAGILGFIVLLWLFLQFVWPHRTPVFKPEYPRQDLTAALDQDTRSEKDYELLYAQTGLSPTAIEDLLALGEDGKAQILETQRVFFEPPGGAPCWDLGITTREHRFRDENGNVLYGAPLAPLQEGDILVSFSTHTAGWKHGHAGLVIDPEKRISLESVVLGSNSAQMYFDHWRNYSTLLVLRPRSDDETRRQVVEFALEKLDNIPYSLICGIFGDKFQPVDSDHTAHCSYLPWYAWAACGLDLDGDGGKIVTPYDLAISDKVEVIQIYGIDPADFPLDFGD